MVILDIRTTPLLAKEGWLRHPKKCCEATVVGADGVVAHNHSRLRPTTPSAPIEEGFAGSS